MGNHGGMRPGKLNDNLPAIKYFKELVSAQTMVQGQMQKMSELKGRVRLTIELTNCIQNQEYSFKAYNKMNNRTVLIDEGKGAYADGNYTVQFNKTLILEYYFEKEQPIEIIITRGGTSLNHQTTMGNIVGSRGGKYSKKVDDYNNETLNIEAKEIKDTNEYVNIEFLIVQGNTKFSWSEPKNRIVFLLQDQAGNALYRSESIGYDGKFQPVKIPSSLMKPKLTLQFINAFGKALCVMEMTFEDFVRQGDGRSFNVACCKHRSIMVTNKSKVVKDYTFLDYLKAGVQLGLNLAIDFTGSNGDPRDQISLHAMRPGFMNDYERAIKSCGNIVAYYDYDQLFPCFGFGAIVPGEQNVNMCFPINGLEDPNIHTIDGIVQCYHDIVTLLTFSGPTYFAPILRRVIDTIKSEMNSLKYEILLILTDGIINDMNETIDLLCIGAKMPLSVIIVGIGEADFTNMDILDADDDPLVNSNGEKCARDLVQFVPFNKYKNNAQKLAEEVLEEIPRQIVEYYTMNNMYPDSLTQ